MKSKDIFKQLLPGVIVGLILGFGLTMLVGVNKTDPIPNYIGGGVCCLVPTLLNCVIVLKGTAKHLKRELSVGDAVKRTIPYALLALVFGLFVVVVVVEKILGVDSRTISVVNTAIYEAILGVVVSTVSAFVALKSYEKQVKYTKRTSKAKK